jgi:hypothetical protein
MLEHSQSEEDKMLSFEADDTFLLKDVSLFVDPVEVYDGTGKLLGIFVPANLERCKQIKARDAQPGDREELQQRLASQERVSHEDMWRRIREVDAENKRRQAAGTAGFTNDEAVAYMRSLRERDSKTSAGPLQANPLPEQEQCPSR